MGPLTIHIPGDPPPLGVRSGQTITVEEGGALPDFFIAGSGSTVNVQGGSVGHNAQVVDAKFNVTEGSVGGSLGAWGGSTVNIIGGKVGSLTARSGSEVNLRGGIVLGSLLALDGSVVDVRGGSVGDGFGLSIRVSLNGADFQLDSRPIPELNQVGDQVELVIPPDVLFTGTLSDGTPFAFHDRDDFVGGTILLNLTELPPVEPQEITLPNDSAPLGVRSG